MNLGNDMLNAARALKLDPNFIAFRRELGKLADVQVHKSIETEPSMRVQATAYAMGVRDLWTALEADANGVRAQQVDRTKMKGQSL